MKKIIFFLVILLISVSANAQTYNQKGKAIIEPATGQMGFDPKENGWNQIRAMNAASVKNSYNGESPMTYGDAKNAWKNVKIKDSEASGIKCIKKDKSFVCN